MSKSGTSSQTQTLPACLRSTSTSCRRIGSPSALATSAIRSACSRSTSGWTTGSQHAAPAGRFCLGASSSTAAIDIHLSIESTIVNGDNRAGGPLGRAPAVVDVRQQEVLQVVGRAGGVRVRVVVVAGPLDARQREARVL